MPLAPGTQDVYDRLRGQISTLREEVAAFSERLTAIERAREAAHDSLEVLLMEIDRLAPDLPSCAERHCDRLARARAKIDASRKGRA